MIDSCYSLSYFWGKGARPPKEFLNMTILELDQEIEQVNRISKEQEKAFQRAKNQ